MEIRRIYKELPHDKRVIVISDIHGNIVLLKKLLEKVNYQQDDYLIILGDCINRGYYSMDTIKYIMELSTRENVFVLIGNHEQDSCYNESFYTNEKIMMYARNEKSLLYEMVKGIDISSWDNQQLITYVLEKYPEIFSFFNSLPHILETPDYLFVHAAYLKENSVNSILRTPNYLDLDYSSPDKWIIVGHYPTANYPTKYFNCNPIILDDRKIVLIDGGNGVKVFGQLNALIIDHGQFRYTYTSDFPLVEVIKSQEEKGGVSLTYKDPYVDLIEDLGEFVKCRYKGKIVWFNHQFVYEDNGKYNARNATDFYPVLKAKDKVELVSFGKTVSMIRKDGIVGYADNRCLNHYVDVKTALEYMGGLKVLYHKTCLRFLNNYQDYEERLLAVINDSHEVFVLVHNLKGVSLNLGAVILYELIKDNNYSNLEEFLDIFRKTYEEIKTICDLDEELGD